MMKWEQRYRIEWDATHGRNGGAQRTVWEMLMEMERFKYRAQEETPSSGSVLPVVRAWATRFSFPRKILRVLCGYFEHQRRVQFEGCVAVAAPDYHGHVATK